MLSFFVVTTRAATPIGSLVRFTNPGYPGASCVPPN